MFELLLEPDPKLVPSLMNANTERTLHYPVRSLYVNKTHEILNNSGIKNKGWSKIKIGFISGNGENPLKNVVYFKNSLQSPFIVDEYPSFIAPKSCQEYIYRIYSNNSDKLSYAKSIWNEVIKS